MGLPDRVREAGVVGAGGAGFPTHVKLAGRYDTIVVNGAECEPVLVTDQRVMAESAEAIVEALHAAAEATGATRIVLGVKHHYADAIARFRPLLSGAPAIELLELADYYPAGDEHVLVHEATGRVVPEGGIPPEVGVLVQNVATLANVRAAMDGRPVTHKHVTVAGAVARPGVYVAPIGTAASEVIAAAGGTPLDDFRVIEGGPMMGPLMTDLDRPVTKTTGGYIVLAANHPLIERQTVKRAADLRRGLSTCCGCRTCSDLCPRALLGHRIRPHLAMRAVYAGTDERPDILGHAFLCSQCGVCEAYACPMGLSPKRVFAAMKERLAAAGAKNSFRTKPDEAQDSQAWARVPKARLTERLGLAGLAPSVRAPSVRLDDPWEVSIPLKQHVGAPSIPLVRTGDRVRAGDCIGEIPQGALGARVHASMDGVVIAVDKDRVRIGRKQP